jgi:hypothetical protein
LTVAAVGWTVVPGFVTSGGALGFGDGATGDGVEEPADVSKSAA